MTLLLTVLMTLQESPDETLQFLEESVKNKDFGLLRKILAEEETASKMTEEEFLEGLAKFEERTGGHLMDALKARPILGALDGSVEEIKLEWVLPVQDGLVSVKVGLKKVGTEWKLGRFRPRLEKEASDPDKGAKAEKSPGDILKAIVSAIEAKEYDKILDYLPQKRREKIKAGEIEKGIADEEEKAGGLWMESIKKVPAIREGQLGVIAITIELRRAVNGRKLGVGMEFVKECGEWKVDEVDIDIEKPENEPPKEPDRQDD